MPRYGWATSRGRDCRSVDLGLRLPMEGRITAGVPAGAGITYTLSVENAGNAGQGLTAEDLTIAVTLPSGSTVVNATGAGYQGVRRDPQAGTDVAVWTVARMAPRDKPPQPARRIEFRSGELELLGPGEAWVFDCARPYKRDKENINPPRTISGQAVR